MNKRNLHNKAIIWTTTSILLWFLVTIATNVLKFLARKSSALLGLLNGPLGIVGDILIMTMIILPMLFKSRYYAKQADLQKLAIVLHVLILLCTTVTLIFAIGLLLSLKTGDGFA